MEIHSRPLIVVAPDSFKGSLSAKAVCDWVEKGIRAALPSARVIKIPLADGGEGTCETLCGEKSMRVMQVAGPLGTKVRARWGFLPDNSTAVIELAQASGLTLVRKEKRDPMRASTFGTGQMISQAIDQGAKKIWLTLGGSATNDGGTGLAKALGYRFLDRDGRDIREGAAGLRDLDRIDASKVFKKIKRVKFLAACDVTNPLCGPRGAAKVYGPQKGADPAMIKEIDQGLRHLAKIIKRDLGKNILNVPGAGAAGGAGGGAIAFLDAALVRGIDWVLDAVDFESGIKNADLLISGEGKVDRQTLDGKTISGVARAAKKHKIPLVLFCGKTEKGHEEILRRGVSKIYSLARPGTSERESILRAGPLLQALARKSIPDIISA